MKNPVEQGHGTQSNPLGMNRLVAIGKPILDKSSKCQKRSITQILTRSDPKIRGQEPKTLSKRAHNPLLKEAGLTNEQVVVGHLAGRGAETGT